MDSSRSGPKGVTIVPFGLTAVMLIVVPINAGHQDVGVAMAGVPDQAQLRRQALIASPFGTIHASTFSLPRPVGTAMPEPPAVRLATLDPSALRAVAPIDSAATRSRRELRTVTPVPLASIDRTLKGDFLAALPRPEAAIDTEPVPPPAQLSTTDEEIEAAARFVPFPEYDISLSLEMNPSVPGEDLADMAGADAGQPDISLLAIANDPDPTARTSRLFFGDVVASSVVGIVPWSAGEEPILMLPRAPDGELSGSAVAALPDSASAPVPDEPRGGEMHASQGAL